MAQNLFKIIHESEREVCGVFIAMTIKIKIVVNKHEASVSLNNLNAQDPVVKPVMFQNFMN